MSTNQMRWYTLRLNPEPWAIGPISVGRKGKGFYPIVGQNTNLAMYQAAVKEELEAVHAEMMEGDIILRFFFWRQLAQYKSDASDRKVQRNPSDTTNLQKALEDALQGVLIANDRKVDDVRSVMVEQGTDVQPLIIIGIESHNASMSDGVIDLPSMVYELLAHMDESQEQLEIELAFPTEKTYDPTHNPYLDHDGVFDE